MPRLFIYLALLLLGSETAFSQVAASQLAELSPRMIGPFRGGRVTAVAGVPHDPHLFYMGSTGGGVWTSDDAGESWRNITDGQFEVGAVGALAVAPSDPNVIYVGTGSVDIRGNISPGRGMYRSTDAGKTWAFSGLPETGHIGRIQIHPTNPDLVYVAALGNAFGPNEDRGVFRSKDGGANWEKVLFISDSTGVVDVSLNPGNPRVLYAAAWNGQRKPWTLISGTTEAGIFRSTDSGDTWTKMETGLPTGLYGKSGVVVSPANPDRVWAIIEAENDQSGIYRTDNGGDSWRKINSDRGLYSRPWYYMHLFADPVDENTVWVTNVFLSKSIDGGKTFNIVPVPHPDSHALWINPNDTDIMIEGDDGGATVTLNGGRTWSTQRNQPTAEFYRVSVDNQFPYRVYGSQQDNTTVSTPSRLSGGVISDTEEEYQVGGCESGHIAVHPENPDVVYAGCYGGSITRFDRKTGQAREIIPYPQLQLAQDRGELKYRFQWNAPIRISPHDPDVVYTTSQVVHRTRNGGQTWDVISPDLTTDNPEHQGFAGGAISKDGTGVEVYGTIFVFEESPHEKGVLWAGSDDGLLHLSRDDGEIWDNVTPDGFPEGATINSIDISAHDPGKMTLAAYRYREADFSPYIYQTSDYGATWRSIGGGIPENDFVRVVREDPVREGLLFAGTEFGLQISFDDGASWQGFNQGFTATSVTDLVIHEGDLVISTQGRSFWILDDITPLRTLTDEVAATEIHLFKPRNVVRASLGGGLNLGPRRRGQNPPDGVYLSYFLKEDAQDELKMQILDAVGDTVRTFTSKEAEVQDLGAFSDLAAVFGLGGGGVKLSKTAGLHRIPWDLKYPAPKPPAGTVLFGTVGPITAVPGDYVVRLSSGDWSSEQTLTIETDPRSEVPVADLQEQFETARMMGDLIEQLGRQMSTVKTARDQVKAIDGVVDDSGLSEEERAQVKDAAKSILDGLDETENSVRQTQSKSFYDPLDKPGKLIAQLVYLYTTVVGGFGGAIDAGPTDGAIDRFGDVEQEAGVILDRLEGIINDQVTDFNELLDRLGMKRVIVPGQDDEDTLPG